MTQHNTTQSINGSVELSAHDEERSSGLPFFVSIVAYVAAVPLLVLACSAVGIV